MRHLVLRAGFIAAASVLAMPALAAQRVEVVTSPPQDQVETLDYWTIDRMKQAERVPTGPGIPVGEVITPGGDAFGYVLVPNPVDHELSRKVGMLFFVSEAKPYHCSTSVVRSESRSMILTAAHCVIEPTGKWFEHMMFVPAYDGEAMDISRRIPLGRWPVRQAFVPSLTARSSASTDVAVARVTASRGDLIEDVVGGGFFPRLTEENEPVSQVKIFGYPGINYQGGELRRCDSRIVSSGISSGFLALNCSTLGGNSGGPHVLDGEHPEVVGVVHSDREHARLQASTFGVVYCAADDGLCVQSDTPHE